MLANIDSSILRLTTGEKHHVRDHFKAQVESFDDLTLMLFVLRTETAYHSPPPTRPTTENDTYINIGGVHYSSHASSLDTLVVGNT